jgi:hypothetical protein
MCVCAGEDDDLLDFFAEIPRRLRATMVTQALHSGIYSGGDERLKREDELFEAHEAIAT